MQKLKQWFAKPIGDEEKSFVKKKVVELYTLKGKELVISCKSLYESISSSEILLDTCLRAGGLPALLDVLRRAQSVDHHDETVIALQCFYYILKNDRESKLLLSSSGSWDAIPSLLTSVFGAPTIVSLCLDIIILLLDSGNLSDLSPLNSPEMTISLSASFKDKKLFPPAVKMVSRAIVAADCAELLQNLILRDSALDPLLLVLQSSSSAAAALSAPSAYQSYPTAVVIDILSILSIASSNPFISKFLAEELIQHSSITALLSYTDSTCVLHVCKIFENLFRRKECASIIYTQLIDAAGVSRFSSRLVESRLASSVFSILRNLMMIAPDNQRDQISEEAMSIAAKHIAAHFATRDEMLQTRGVKFLRAIHLNNKAVSFLVDQGMIPLLCEAAKLEGKPSESARFVLWRLSCFPSFQPALRDGSNVHKLMDVICESWRSNPSSVTAPASSSASSIVSSTPISSPPHSPSSPSMDEEETRRLTALARDKALALLKRLLKSFPSVPQCRAIVVERLQGKNEVTGLLASVRLNASVCTEILRAVLASSPLVRDMVASAGGLQMLIENLQLEEPEILTETMLCLVYYSMDNPAYVEAMVNAGAFARLLILMRTDRDAVIAGSVSLVRIMALQNRVVRKELLKKETLKDWKHAMWLSHDARFSGLLFICDNIDEFLLDDFLELQLGTILLLSAVSKKTTKMARTILDNLLSRCGSDATKLLDLLMKGQRESAVNWAHGFAITGLTRLLAAYLTRVGSAHPDDLKNRESNLTPLHYAAFGYQFETIRYLVSTGGSNVNAVDNNGRTALHALCMKEKDAPSDAFEPWSAARITRASGSDVTVPALRPLTPQENSSISSPLPSSSSSSLSAPPSSVFSPSFLAAPAATPLKKLAHTPSSISAEVALNFAALGDHGMPEPLVEIEASSASQAQDSVSLSLDGDFQPLSLTFDGSFAPPLPASQAPQQQQQQQQVELPKPEIIPQRSMPPVVPSSPISLDFSPSKHDGTMPVPSLEVEVDESDGIEEVSLDAQPVQIQASSASSSQQLLSPLSPSISGSKDKANAAPKYTVKYDRFSLRGQYSLTAISLQFEGAASSMNELEQGIQFLLENHAHVDHTDIDGRSPLMWTILRGRPESLQIAQLLLARGATISLVSSADVCNAFELAVKLGRTDLVDLFLKKDSNLVPGRESQLWTFLREQRMHYMISLLISRSNFSLQWVPDEDAASCFICEKDFTLLFRKHHCRNCGCVCCGDCSTFTFLPSLGSKEKTRVCSMCHAVLEGKDLSSLLSEL